MNNNEILKELNSLSLFPDKNYQEFLKLVLDYKINLSDRISIEEVIEKIKIEFDNIIIPKRGKTGRVYANGMSAVKVQKLRIKKSNIASKKELLKKYLDYYDMSNVSNSDPVGAKSDPKDYDNNETGRTLLRSLIDKLKIDIAVKVDKKKKRGNQIWKYTDGEIYRRISKDLGGKLKESSAITEIKTYRWEKFKGKSK